MSFENELNYLNLNEEQESLNQRIVLTQDEVDDILKEYPDGSDMTSILDIDSAELLRQFAIARVHSVPTIKVK